MAKRLRYVLKVCEGAVGDARLRACREGVYLVETSVRCRVARHQEEKEKLTTMRRAAKPLSGEYKVGGVQCSLF